MSDDDTSEEYIGTASADVAPFTREDLDGLGELSRPQHAALTFRPECHPRAGMAAGYCRDCGTLQLACGECGTPVGAFVIGVRARH